MNNKPLKKVCTKCLDANKQLQLNADFFVEVQYGICDCCGNRGIVIPFERFFNTNTKLMPCTAEEKVEQHKETLEPTQYEADIRNIHGRIDPLVEVMAGLNKETDEHLVLIRELQDKTGRIEAMILTPVQPENYTPQPMTTPKQPQSQKQPKNAKVDGDAAYE